MRKLAVVLAGAMLSGCVWGQTTPKDCAAYAANSGSDMLEQTARAAGVAKVELTHALCSSKLERLAGLRTGRAEVGWCAKVKETVPATAAAIRASSAAQCAEALRRGAVYAQWDTVVADQFFFVSGDYQNIGPLFPRGAPNDKKVD